ncbi:MAG: DUF4783 domain-containing protein [Bacteroidales bacterium]|nr:DUF4783 domain-containing protein [Bacteroidales bacterium]
MKPLSHIYSAIILISLISFQAKLVQAQDLVSDNVIKAISKGDASELSKLFNSTIDISIPENDGTYSKDQAEIIVKKFFKKNPVTKFSINHSGSSNDGSKYSIGTYKSNDKTFRVYFLLKKTSEKYFIQQLQFELE